MPQPPYEGLVFTFSHPALLRGLHWGDLAALGGRSVFVAPERVASCEEVATVIAEVNYKWVPLRGLTVPFELFEVFEIRIRA